jgi:hypothetical protein
MTQEEKNDFFYQIGKMEKKMDEVENKMYENRKDMEKRCYNFKIPYLP